MYSSVQRQDEIPFKLGLVKLNDQQPDNVKERPLNVWIYATLS